jgi:uncharacterized protein
MQKKIQFQSDEFMIYGFLHLPTSKNPPSVIGSHGLMSSGDSPKQIALAESCAENGMAYFRFDHRGCGESSGEFTSATTFEGRCRDLIRALQFIQGCPETGNQIALFGSSFGGAVSLAVSHLFHTRAVVTVAAPVRLDAIRPPYINDPENKRRLESLSRINLNFDISGLLADISNILIFHGDSDAVVPFSNALEIYNKTKSPKKLIRQEGGDHPMGNPLHQKEFIRLAVEWFRSGFNSDTALTAHY